MAYFILSLVTKRKGIQRTINNFKIRFPARWSRYYQSDYEADNYSFLKARVEPGMHIIDIGAHLGLFSVISSELVGSSGRIICFEPTPGTYEILLQTLKLNRCENVTAVLGAVSNQEGSATFYVSELAGCNTNSLLKIKPEGETIESEVKLYTIDRIVQEYSIQPRLIKIDAEGAELNTLQGGINTLRQCKPMIILGLHPQFIIQKGDTLENIWDLLERSGYEVRQRQNKLTKSDFCKHKLIFDVQCV